MGVINFECQQTFITFKLMWNKTHPKNGAMYDLRPIFTVIEFPISPLDSQQLKTCAQVQGKKKRTIRGEYHAAQTDRVTSVFIFVA